jgi:hypothetical protein
VVLAGLASEIRPFIDAYGWGNRHKWEVAWSRIKAHHVIRHMTFT